jgi:predicted ribosome quality control (RQC) complex YloA/Tae2 family protein
MNRFSAVDVRAAVWDMQQTLQGLRAANIYNIGPKAYIFKV